jgi:YteA family regulatory protein
MSNEKQLNQMDLDTCYQSLITEKEDIERRLFQKDDEGLSLSQRENTQELSMIDNHPADTATDLTERTKDLAIHQHEQLHLDDIYEALARIEVGTYGTCHTCHEAIDSDRLLAIPTTIYCQQHMADHPLLDRRPVEEEFLSPPFGRTSLDEREDESEFDGEDAWQVVESWGNSDSPAMSENRDVTSYEDVYMESDELVGCVEPIESFLATDITGQHVEVIRNQTYRNYMRHGEGEPLLEWEEESDSR